MRKDRLYIWTFFVIAIIVTSITFLAAQFYIDLSNKNVFQVQLENSRRESNQLAYLVEKQLEATENKSKVASQLLQSVDGTMDGQTYISLIDWSGKYVVHPVKTQIGTQVDDGEYAAVSVNEQLTSEQLHDIIMDDARNNDNPERSQIIHLTPIKNSDWIVAAQLNVIPTLNNINQLKSQFYILFAIMGIALIVCSFLAVRILGSSYERKLEMKNVSLEKELINVSKLNNDLVVYQQKIKENDTGDDAKTDNDPNKKRILTYRRDELLTIPIETIAYIYVDNTITYVICFDGKQSTTNSSLDELYAGLDTTNFFRANRQVIIAVQAIQKIRKYGKNQLKIIVSPESDTDIIISKNKAAEFKQWLNM